MTYPDTFYFHVLSYRLLGTPNEEVWPGVSKLMNWHEYPQWNPQKLSSAVPNLDENGLDLLLVSLILLLVCWEMASIAFVLRAICLTNFIFFSIKLCRRCCSMNRLSEFQQRKLWNTLTLMIWKRPISENPGPVRNQQLFGTGVLFSYLE